MTTERGTARLRVILVDDDPVIGVMLSIGLPEIELVEANTIERARELLTESEPDAVIVDRRLPDGDGLELVREIRRTSATSRTPIVLITAGHDEAARAEVTRAGADRYVAKPIEPDVLIAHVQSVLDVVPADRRGHRLASARGDVDARDATIVDGDADGGRPSFLARLFRRTG